MASSSLLTRHLTNDALRSIVFETDFSHSDLDALNSIEVAAPASEELVVVMPAQSVPSAWFSPMLETESPEVVKRKVRIGLASAISVWSGTDPDEIATDVAAILRRWGSRFVRRVGLKRRRKRKFHIYPLAESYSGQILARDACSPRGFWCQDNLPNERRSHDQGGLGRLP